MYQLDVWIEILHMTFSTFHSSGNSVHRVYSPSRAAKYPIVNHAALSYTYIKLHG